MEDLRYRTARWRKTRARVIRRDGRICSQPGCTTDMTQPGMTQVDHIIELRDGGDFYDETNLEVMCFHHHQAKTANARANRQKRSPNA